MKKIAIVLIIISISFSLFAENTESIEDTEDTENYFYFSNSLISENGELIFGPNVGYYFSDDSSKSFIFRYSPASTYTINQENEESFCDYLMKGKQLFLTGRIPLINDENSSEASVASLFIIPRLSVDFRNNSFDNYDFNLFNGLKIYGYFPSKKEGFVIETENEDYYSLDTINRGKRLNFFTNFSSQNSSNNSSYYQAIIQLGQDLGGTFLDNWLYMNDISSNFAFSYNKRLYENEEERIRKSVSCSISDNFNLIYDSKDNYSITLKTGFNLSIQGEDAANFFNSKYFNFYTDLNYKQKINALTYELLGNFGMNNSWNLDNDNNYQYDKSYSLLFNGNLSYEISEGLDILSSCTLDYAKSNDDSYYSRKLEGNLSYEISESLETFIGYRITKAFHDEESEISQSLAFEVNAEITDKFYFEVSTDWVDFEAIKISANLKVNI